MIYNQNGDLMEPGLYKFITDDVYDDPSYKNVSDQMEASLIEQHKTTKKEKGIFDCCYELFWPTEGDFDDL